MDPNVVSHVDETQSGRPQRERAPPRYLQDYQTEFYGQPPIQIRDSAESETVLLRHEVAQLKSIVKELTDKVEQYGHSYSEADSEEECDIQPHGAQHKVNMPLQTHIQTQCNKSQSQPNLTEPLPALRPGKISQSVQTLFPCVHRPSHNLECEHERPASVPKGLINELQPQAPSPPLPSDASTQMSSNPAPAPHCPQSSASPVAISSTYVPSSSVQPPYDAPDSVNIPPVIQPLSSAPVNIPILAQQASSTHVYQMDPPAPSHMASTTTAAYNLYSRLPPTQGAQPLAHVMQPPCVPPLETQPASLQPSASHPSTSALYQSYPVFQLPSQQLPSRFSVPQPASVSYVSQPARVVPNPDSSLPVVSVQQTPYPRYLSRIEGPSFPYFTHNDPHEFVMLKMAFNNLLSADEPELYKFHILLDHLRLPAARHIALSFAHDRQPFTMALAALERQYGQPHHLALKEIQIILNLPKVARGDAEGFQAFAVRVRSLVGMLQSLNSPEGAAELACASHVQRLLSKLPAELVSHFARHARSTSPYIHYNLMDFSAWLEGEAECQTVVAQTSNLQSGAVQAQRRNPVFKFKPPSTTILYGSQRALPHAHPASGQQPQPQTRYPCAYCNSTAHYLTNCDGLKELSTDEVMKWLKDHRRCWKCGRNHRAADCTLKKPCPKCNGLHLGIFHELNKTQTSSRVLYLNPQSMSPKVLLKVVKVRLFNKNKSFDTYAILDDGSERTMLLPGAAECLGLKGEPEKLELGTVRQQTETLKGESVNLKLSAASCPERKFSIDRVFTSDNIMFVQQSYPVDKLMQRYPHLHGLPLTPFSKVQPHILIGSDNPFLIMPTERIQYGPKGAPAAVKTRLGWALQGPTYLSDLSEATQCLFTSQTNPYTELKQHVEKLWQVDTLPFRSEKIITRSKQDEEAINLLTAKTTRVHIDGIDRYATPLLRKKAAPELRAPYDSVMPLLRRSERKLQKNPLLADIYNNEIKKLKEAGAVAEVTPQQTETKESWYIPHHLVEHNHKHRVVFNCSFTYQGQVLNDQLLPGPTLGPSLLGVLLRFRQHRVAISGDIKGMFHQVRLLPEDKPLLRFLWRDMKRKERPTIYQWQVLPFGTTCSPCCATFALQKHVQDHSLGNEDVLEAVLQTFYVDNCLNSLPCPDAAQELLTKIKDLLASGGFEMRQWASNFPSVVAHLPPAARSDSAELWLNQDHTDPVEGILGLSWHCLSDTLGYKHRPVVYQTLTMRNVYKVLASQYDPLGYIIPFTTRAKILLQQLWVKNKQWDHPIPTGDLLRAWDKWESELPNLETISFPRWYEGYNQASEKVKERELHIFCDASEKAYGSVAYLRTTNESGGSHVSFVMARSRVAPLKQLTIPRLELSAALTGAQLSKLIKTELTVSIDRTFLWSDSTVVLTWLRSESCRYKTFVANRIVEILELTSVSEWKYVDTKQNPADDITRGKQLKELTKTHRWHTGPAFLHIPCSLWPVCPTQAVDTPTELKKTLFCGLTQSTKPTDLPDPRKFTTWTDLVDAACKSMQDSHCHSNDLPRTKVEAALISQAQAESFPEEFQALKNGKDISSQSRLLPLSPEYDKTLEVIRVGGRLRQSEDLEPDIIHPIVLDPKHPLTQLLITDYDRRLFHSGPARVFAEIRRAYWILRGRQAIKKHQWSCVECRKWRAKPVNPKMADLPSCRLRLWKPPFWSTGVDCFGPLTIKVGRRVEKRWGILFKCMTTRCTHIELLNSLDSDSFLMSLRRFIARRGQPYELLSDCGTNFKGGERELSDAFAVMNPQLKEVLKKSQIQFHFNPPNAPHFGGMWEREIRTIKAALRVTVGSQTVAEEVLHTVLVEIEGMVNSKPIGYASSDIADPDPITPNLLLMGRRDTSLPQAVYADTNLIGSRRWRHSQILADQFWSYFIRNYLPNLQVRNKWQKDTQKMKEGTIVLLMDPQLPRGLWPIGKVTRIIHSSDGRIRTVEVNCKEKKFIRPVARLVILAPAELEPKD